MPISIIECCVNAIFTLNRHLTKASKMIDAFVDLTPYESYRFIRWAVFGITHIWV